MELLHNIDGPILRMSSQLNDFEDHVEISRSANEILTMGLRTAVTWNIIGGSRRRLLLVLADGDSRIQPAQSGTEEVHRLFFGFTAKPVQEKVRFLLS